MIDLSMFQDKEFKALQVIKINSVKLKNISALSSSFLPQLKRLDLQENEITDDCINVFKNLKLPKIIFLSLFDNKITSPEIFEPIKQYDSLKTFFIGKNSFEENETINSDKIYELNPNLEELGITDNFTTETNEFITKNLRLENLKILYITSNGFTTFKSFENIHFKKIEQIWARGDIKKGFITDITEINYFNRKEKIKQINLKKNKINNIEKLPSIIKNFPKLKILNVEDNNIDYDKIKYVKEEIKKIKGFEKFKIIYK
jgi:Leucine-rich repeat (LRR) protein